VFDEGYKHEQRRRNDGGMSYESNDAMSTLKSTGKSAKRRVDGVVGDEEAEDEDEADDDGRGRVVIEHVECAPWSCDVSILTWNA
jgi:hypothetical protein